MASNPIFPLYYNDMDRSTRDWTDEEFGAYLRLLMHQWDKFGLPLGFDRLARIAPSVEKNWGVLSSKFVEVDGKMVNPRLEEIREDMLSFRQRQKENGKKGGRPKSRNKSTENPATNPIHNPNKTLHNEEEVESENEGEQGNQEGGAGETRPSYGGEQFLVPRMLHLWKESMPVYPDDPQLDGKALGSIADFLCKRGNLRGAPHENAEPILEAWEHICRFIAEDRFYKQKSLKTIANCIQEILQKALNGDQSKPTETGRRGGKLDPEKLKAGLRARFAQRQQGAS